MPTSSSVDELTFLDRLREDRPLVAAELRPPRSDLGYSESMDAWIDLHHTIRRLTRRDTVVFLTDNAVGVREEENLHHITTNLAGEVPSSRIVPFLTCKHSLEYCLLYAAQVASEGIDALTVLGGDRSVGPPRCVPHAYQLRQMIRERYPSLTLGGWANPHRDPAEQVGYLTDMEFTAEFCLTQVVSHHSMPAVEAFRAEAKRQGLSVPLVFGVFFYRSPNPETLETLSDFFPVPAERLTREFEEGASAAEICARTIRALREVGADKVYVSNLGYRRAAQRLGEVVRALEG